MSLRDRLSGPWFAFDTPGATAARGSRSAIAQQLEDYVLPRLDRDDAPLLAVVGGPTGAGKSTLVNTLAGGTVSRAGVLRPTTRTPVLVCAESDEPWFLDRQVLPGLARSSQPVVEDDGLLHIATCAELPPGLALVDAPDIDSVVDANRELAAKLLAAADLWLFVTTAARYSDAVPWEYLGDASSRGVAVAMVLDRLPVEGGQDAAQHFAQLLATRGLGDAPFFTIGEVPLGDGRLPAEVVEPLRSWLARVADEPDVRDVLVRRTFDGTVASLPTRLDALSREARRQEKADSTLRAGALAAYARAREQLDTTIMSGLVVRGEVLARWRRFIGGNDVLRDLADDGPSHADALGVAVHAALRHLVLVTTQHAVDRVVDRWTHHPAGRSLLAGNVELRKPASDLPARGDQLLERWRARVAERVGPVGRGTGSTADVVGLILRVVALLPADEATGESVDRATARTTRVLLEAVLGGDTPRRLVATVRGDLQGEMQVLLDAEMERYTHALDRAEVARYGVDRLREMRFGLDAAS